jgi:putative membrane protein
MKGFLIGVAVTAIAFAVLAYFIPQIQLGDQVIEYVALGLVFGVVNALIKPIVKLFSFPITAMTLGLFGLVINTAMLMLVSWLCVEFFDIPFSIAGFPESGLSLEAIGWAFVASIGLSLISTVIGLVVHD